jgi:molybdenum cofactor biosynthesis protein B
MSHRAHRRTLGAAVPCAVVTVSDTRTPATDTSGRLLCAGLERAGHPVVGYRILEDDPRVIRTHLRTVRREGRARAVLVTGGTGIAPRDTTFEAIDGILDKRLDGFGEIFRMLSYRQVGSAAMLSRAVAGIWGDLVLVSMPGSPAAVRLALRRLILPELGHLADLIMGEGRGRA